MTDELKPCPFCGKTSGILFPPTCDRKTPYNPADRAFPIVRCSNCFAEAVGTDWDKSGKTAIAAWNTRAQPETEVAPDDEALILNFESAIEVLSDPDRPAQPAPDLEAFTSQHFGKPMPLTSVLYALAGQEGNDGDAGNAMQAAADAITTLRAQLADALAAGRMVDVLRRKAESRVAELETKNAVDKEIVANLEWAVKRLQPCDCTTPCGDDKCDGWIAKQSLVSDLTKSEARVAELEAALRELKQAQTLTQDEALFSSPRGCVKMFVEYVNRVADEALNGGAK